MPVTSISKHVYESVKLKFTAVTVSSLIYYWMIIYVNGIVHLKTILSLLNSCWYKPIWLSSTEYKRRFLELDCVNHFFIFIKLEKNSLGILQNIFIWVSWFDMRVLGEQTFKDSIKHFFVSFFLSAEVLWESRAFGERREALRYHCFHPWRVPNQQKDCFNFRNTARQKPPISVQALWDSGGEP